MTTPISSPGVPIPPQEVGGTTAQSPWDCAPGNETLAPDEGFACVASCDRSRCRDGRVGDDVAVGTSGPADPTAACGRCTRSAGADDERGNDPGRLRAHSGAPPTSFRRPILQLGTSAPISSPWLVFSWCESDGTRKRALATAVTSGCAPRRFRCARIVGGEEGKDCGTRALAIVGSLEDDALRLRFTHRTA